MKELAAFVAQVMKATRRRKVALVASSRGGNAVRNYLKNGGGAEFVSHAVLCGTPNKGIVISDTLLVGSEFNGAAALPQGAERRAGRSHPRRRDDGDPLRQERQVLPARRPLHRRAGQADRRRLRCLRAARRAQRHPRRRSTIARRRSTSWPSPRMYEFITGKPPASMFIAQEPLPVLNGKVTGMADGTLHQPRGRRRRGRDLRGRRQDRRAQERRGRCIARPPARTACGGPSSAAPTPTTSSCCAWRRSRSPTPTARRSCARATWCICGPSVFAKGDEARGRRRQS